MTPLGDAMSFVNGNEIDHLSWNDAFERFGHGTDEFRGDVDDSEKEVESYK